MEILKAYSKSKLSYNWMLVICFLIFQATVTSAIAQNDRSISGNWKTSYGVLTLPDVNNGSSFRAPYTYRGGEMHLTREDDILQGFWVQEVSDSECDTVLHGSHYWGKIVLTLDMERRTFAGPWSYCDGELGSNWAGEKIINSINIRIRPLGEENFIGSLTSVARNDKFVVEVDVHPDIDISFRPEVTFELPYDLGRETIRLYFREESRRVGGEWRWGVYRSSWMTAGEGGYQNIVDPDRETLAFYPSSGVDLDVPNGSTVIARARNSSIEFKVYGSQFDQALGQNSDFIRGLRDQIVRSLTDDNLDEIRRADYERRRRAAEHFFILMESDRFSADSATNLEDVAARVEISEAYLNMLRNGISEDPMPGAVMGADRRDIPSEFGFSWVNGNEFTNFSRARNAARSRVVDDMLDLQVGMGRGITQIAIDTIATPDGLISARSAAIMAGIDPMTGRPPTSAQTRALWIGVVRGAFSHEIKSNVSRSLNRGGNISGGFLGNPYVDVEIPRFSGGGATFSGTGNNLVRNMVRPPLVRLLTPRRPPTPFSSAIPPMRIPPPPGPPRPLP